MSKNMQVFCITHLPQIASLGQNHFYVYKDHQAQITSSKLKKLNKEERTNEIAQMIGGNDFSNASLEAATALLNK